MSDITSAACAIASGVIERFEQWGDFPAVQSTFDSASARRRVAMGDPQAPFSKVLDILNHHRLLTPEGRLQDDVQLVSMGDHFDWGKPAEREQAARDALHLLGWFLSHPQGQVVLLAGNHDLSRVGELAEFDDARFQRAQAEADALYLATGGQVDPAQEHAFLRRYPELPSAEVASRDCGTFRAEQRVWVRALLRHQLLKLAHAPHDDLLLLHAGMTSEDLNELGLPEYEHANAPSVARHLNEALNAAASLGSGRVMIEGVHHPGDARFGEGKGILFHRPAHPDCDDPALFRRPWPRRFDPRRLPRGLTQAVGHIHDAKCRTLLGPWADAAVPRIGVLRHLQTDGASVHYAHGVVESDASKATILFLDGRMLQCEAEQFELLDLDTRRPFAK